MIKSSATIRAKSVIEGHDFNSFNTMFRKRVRGKKLQAETKEIGSRQCTVNLNQEKLTTFVVLGDKQVGKTSLASRFTENFFSPNYAPTVEDCYFKNYYDRSQETTHNLRIIDTSGYYHFPAMQRLNIVHADIILLVYEVRNVQSMKRLGQLYTVVREELKDRTTTPIICVGTKIDKTKDTDNYQDGAMEEFFRCNSDELFSHILTSARLNINVTDVFQRGLDMMQQLKMQQISNGASAKKFQDVVFAKMKDISVFPGSNANRQKMIRKRIEFYSKETVYCNIYKSTFVIPYFLE